MRPLFALIVGVQQAFVSWADISASGSGYVVGSNGDQIFTVSGTIFISSDLSSANLSVIKNGVSAGLPPSLSVTTGDAVHFLANASLAPGETLNGHVTISGLASDTFNVTLLDTRPAQ